MRLHAVSGLFPGEAVGGSGVRADPPATTFSAWVGGTASTQGSDAWVGGTASTVGSDTIDFGG